MTAETYHEKILDSIRSAERSRQDVVYVAFDDLPPYEATALLTSPAVLLETLPDHDRPIVLARLPDPRLLAPEPAGSLERSLTF